MRPQPTDDNFPHGTYTGYQYKCRCKLCKGAYSEYKKEWRLRTGRSQNVAGPKQGHGTRACYVRGCRLPECVQANREYQRQYMRLRRSGQTMVDPWIEEALR